MKITAIHDGKGFVGCIETLEQYVGVRDGKLDWKLHIKAQMDKVIIPCALFDRLMELDRQSQAKEVKHDDNSARTE